MSGGGVRDHVTRIACWAAAVRRVSASYATHHGRRPNLLRPRRYTEKMQWRKLFDRNPIFPILCDKHAVRAHVAARVGGDALVPLLWSGPPDEIPFDELEPPYVLKSTHGTGHTLFVREDEIAERSLLVERAAAWMKHCHATAQDEPGYLSIPRGVVAERLVATRAGEPPLERRVFVFDGKAAVVNTVFVEDGRIRNGAFHTPDWTRLDWHFTRIIDHPFPPPARLDDLIATAERIAEGLDHARVDFYDCDERIFVGEVTIYSWSGWSRFVPDEADFLLGAHWHLPAPARRAATAILFERREIEDPHRHATPSSA